VQALKPLFVMCGLVLGWALTPLTAAYADETPDCAPGQTTVQSQYGGWICVAVVVPGQPGVQQATDQSGGTGGSGVALPACRDIYSGSEVPCTDPNSGAWFDHVWNGEGCNAFRLQPQPPPGDPRWEGRNPSEGNVWGCDPDFANNGNTFFVPRNRAPALVDPAALAQRALGQMQLVAADANIAPGPNFHTYVHIDNWLWLPASQWRSLDLTVSAGPTSVTVTAAPVRVEWDMGTETVECPDAGRVWKKGMTDAAKTSCSYVYESIENLTGDIHEVSARIVHAVTWTCSGACLTPSGDLGEIAAPAGEMTTIEVRQRQTVVTN
jgi:hypothetical protein